MSQPAEKDARTKLLELATKLEELDELLDPCAPHYPLAAAKAIRAQTHALHAMKVDGKVDAETWKRLTQDLAASALRESAEGL